MSMWNVLLCPDLFSSPSIVAGEFGDINSGDREIVRIPAYRRTAILPVSPLGSASFALNLR